MGIRGIGSRGRRRLSRFVYCSVISWIGFVIFFAKFCVSSIIF